MNIDELDSFTLDDAVNFHEELNPQLFNGEKLRPPVRAKLLEIAQDFMAFIGITDMALVDITLSGSNAAYSYTPFSDIDLHLVVDFGRLGADEVYRELFDAKKYQYNDQHAIKVKSYDVEVYVQDANQPHTSLGEYSVTRDNWNKIPTTRRANLNDGATKIKYEKLRQISLMALAADNLDYTNRVLDVLKRYRRAGLNQGGEFSPENLAFKMIRKQGLFKKLWDKKRAGEDRILSLETVTPLSEQIKQEFNNSRLIEATVKHLYNMSPDIFDRHSLNTVWAYAVKLIEDGRIVQGVNTTCDVGLDQISIEAAKLGFKVDRGGVPLTESYDVVLKELNMSPGFLKGEVGKLLQRATPVLGAEMEVCWPRDNSDFEGDSGIEITPDTTWEDIQSFFQHNTDDSDFRNIKQDHEEWILDQAADWATQKTHEAAGHPGQDAEQKLDIIVDNTEYDRDAAKRILQKAEESYEKFGDANEWDMVEDLSEESQIYHELFVDNDENLEVLNDYYTTDFFEGELPWDDENWTVGAWLANHRKYNNMQELFWEYSDDLYWPGGSMTDEVYDDDIAGRIASDLSDLGLEAEATGEYHSGQHDDSGHRSEWNIEEDTSIAPEEGDAGFEIVSPALDYADAISQFSTTVKYLLQNNAYTNESCGLHINVSLRGVSHSELDYPKLVLMTGDQYLLKQFGREMNSYAISAVQQMDNILTTASMGGAGAQYFKKFLATVSKKVDKTLASAMGGYLDFGKQTSIGIKSNRIEFRIGGGEGYLDNWESEIVPMIHRFIVAYAVACDPEAYKKDYAKKLYKLASSNLQSKGQRTEEALKLFALFASGSMTKEQLVAKVKQLQATGPKKEAKIQLNPQKMAGAAQRLSALHDVDTAAMMREIQRGVEYENKAGMAKNADDMHPLIVTNLMRDPNYYKEIEHELD